MVIFLCQAEVAQAKQQLQSVYTKLEECEKSVENGREEVEQVFVKNLPVLFVYSPVLFVYSPVLLYLQVLLDYLPF